MTRPGPPGGPRQNSRDRAAKAFNLRCKGWTWRDIATELGYRSHAGAITAVRQHLARQPTEDQAILKAYTAGSYQLTLQRLQRLADKAETAEDFTASATIARAIGDLTDKHAKLTGQYVEPDKPDVEVNVTVGLTPAAVIGEARSNLLAIAAARRAQMPAIAPPAPVVDAEVVEA
ncbi:hypothetical protein B1R94_02225 [Mycolicibacterium litorale]|nr:hypothetical protein B1R94_02225 [Mycolicibacterium litorale]